LFRPPPVQIRPIDTGEGGAAFADLARHTG
jgi:hypothetical protein